MSELIKEEVVIKDACIIFDLIDLGLLDSFYQLPIKVITTQLVLEEVKDDAQLKEVSKYVEKGQLVVDGMSSWGLVEEIIAKNPGLSATDATVIEVASRRAATVLSSDKSLRSESKRRGLNVRGMLWILEELFIHGVISKEDLLQKLNIYPTINQRVPKGEIDNLVRKYT